MLRLGIVDCDTSHVYQFARRLNHIDIEADQWVDGANVVVAWEGGSRDLMIQLYRADLGLVHEDLAPRTGASRITFRRPDLGAMDYELRVVSLQPATAIPFTLNFSHWEN